MIIWPLLLGFLALSVPDAACPEKIAQCADEIAHCVVLCTEALELEPLVPCHIYLYCLPSEAAYGCLRIRPGGTDTLDVGTCRSGSAPIFSDGFESGGLERWDDHTMP